VEAATEARLRDWTLKLWLCHSLVARSRGAPKIGSCRVHPRKTSFVYWSVVQQDLDVLIAVSLQLADPLKGVSGRATGYCKPLSRGLCDDKKIHSESNREAARRLT
jgi:hypothetical protein